MNNSHTETHGFTLIELSIVLVIIGLIIGGVLAGKDLVQAAAARAQITQIERYNTAAHTFQTKYGYMPGDLPEPYASNFGFKLNGHSDRPYSSNGDGIINNGQTDTPGGYEAALFWQDLSQAGLIEQTFNTVDETFSCCGNGDPNTLFPSARIGSGFVYVWSPGSYTGGNGICQMNGTDNNYWGISAITSIMSYGRPQISGGGNPNAAPNMTPGQAYSIDAKIDDGMPQSGNVTAIYLVMSWGCSGVAWSQGWPTNPWPNYPPVKTTAATSASATSCMDNGGVANGPVHYSVGQPGVNCTLAIRFQ